MPKNLLHNPKPTYGGSSNKLLTDCRTTLQVEARQHPHEMYLEPRKERNLVGIP
jgi:hypothetical protein